MPSKSYGIIPQMQLYLIVFIGAGLGGALRHGVNELAARALGVGFTYGTIIVNILGSLLIGVLISYFALRGEASHQLKLFLTTGLLGGFTTFSAFSLEVVLLYERNEIGLAIGYAIASVVLSSAAVLTGMWIVRQLGS